MIANHNVKVNGRWYAAGEMLPGTQEEPKGRTARTGSRAPKQEEAPNTAETPEVPQEEKPKTAQRNKTAK
jgi:hypothetical protein